MKSLKEFITENLESSAFTTVSDDNKQTNENQENPNNKETNENNENILKGQPNDEKTD